MYTIFLIFIGFAIGFLNSLAIMWTAKQIVKNKNTFIVVPSLFFRLALICLMFYIFLDKNWKNALYMLIGLTISKISFIIFEKMRGTKK